MIWIIATIIIIIFYLFFCTIPKSNDYSAVVKLPWKIIKNIYQVNPDRLSYESVYVKRDYEYTLSMRPVLLLNYNTESYGKNGIWSYNNFRHCYMGNVVAVKISIVNVIKILLFYFLNKRKSVREENNTIIFSILAAAQNDIDKLKAKAEQEIDYARKTNDEIGWRIASWKIENI